MDEHEGRGPEPQAHASSGFFEAAPVLTTVAGGDGYFRELGGPWTEVTGWSLEELTSRPFFDFVHPDDIAVTAAELAHLAGGGVTIAFVNRYARADGGWVYLQWHARPVDAERIFAVALDVTAVIEQRHVVERQQQLLRIVADLQQDALVGHDGAAAINRAIGAALPLVAARTCTFGTVELDADASHSVTWIAWAGTDAPGTPGGRTPLLPRVQVDFANPDARATALEVVSAVISDERPRAARSLDSRADGPAAFLLGLPVGGDRVVGVVVLGGDEPFTEGTVEFLRPLIGAIATIIERDRRSAASSIMSSEVARLSSVLAAMLDRSGFVLIATDARERVTFVSTAASRMLGSDAAATEQWSVERLLAPGHDAGLSLAACFPIGATSVREVEWTFLGAGGTTVPMVVSGSTIVDPNGDNEGWVLMCTPLAERQQAEQERVEHASLAAQVDLLRSRERQLAALAETTQYVVASRTRREALEVIDHFLPTAFGPSRVRLLRAVGGERTAERDTPDGSVLATDCWAARTGRAFHSERDHGVRCTHLPSTGRHLCTPLSDGQHLAGILTVDLTTGADHDGLGLVGIESMVDDVASQLSAALANLRLRRALEDQALIDPLTRLGNRRAADRALGDALGRLRSHGEPCAVLMLDIDHFKAINDRHGHDVGDEVLAGFARILDNLVREEDHVARLGGEEFLIVLRDVRREDLDAIVESIRHGIERATFPRGVTTTASIGAVHVADRGVTADEAVAAADALLYEAKRAGRNRAAVGGTDHTPPIGSARIPTPEVTP